MAPQSLANALYLEGFVGEEITAFSVRSHLEAAAGAEVTIRVNSPGGILMEGLSIQRALAEYPGNIVAVVEGIAASAATVILMGADKIIMPTGALMMIHDPSAVTIGSSETHRNVADVLDKMAESVAAIYAARTGLPVKKCLDLMTAETWMNGTEAKALGFADETSLEPAKEPVAFNWQVFCNAPQWLLNSNKIRKSNMPTELNMKPKDITREILAKCALAKMSIEESESVIDLAAGDLAKVENAIIDTLAARDPDGGRISWNTNAHEDKLTANGVFGKVITDAIYARLSGKSAQGHAAEWQGRSLLDMGAATLQARGEKIISFNRDKLATQIMNSGSPHSTSDFPILTVAAGNRFLGESYLAAECALKQIARERNAVDFRALTTARLSEAPALSEVEEGAEVTYGSRAEAKESYRVKTFAKIFSISRQALINDDLQAFADTLQAFGRAAAETEASEIVALFAANAGNGVNLDDGTPVFTTGRGNKAATGTALTVTSVGLARKALRDTKGLDGITPISATPRFLVVGSAKETEAEMMLASLAAAQVGDVNPFSGKLTLLVEPRLAGNAWRIFADPSQASVLEVAYLNGNKMPMLETKDGWTTLGTEFRAVLDFGCGITGWRGSYLNAGE